MASIEWPLLPTPRAGTEAGPLRMLWQSLLWVVVGAGLCASVPARSIS